MPVILITQSQEIELENHHDKTIIDLARNQGLFLKSSCGGKGKCGRCLIDLIEGRFLVGDKEVIVKKTMSRKALSCMTKVQGENAIIKIPKDTMIETSGQIIDNFILKHYEHNPSTKKVLLHIPHATLENQKSDREGVEEELLKQAHITKPKIPLPVLRKLPDALLKNDRAITLTLGRSQGFFSVIDVEPGDTTHSQYGLAMDIGTTTVVGILIDLNKGNIVGKASLYNRQITLAEDVISRISYIRSQKEVDLLKSLMIDDSVNPIIRHLCGEVGIKRNEIVRMALSGNTIMIHLLLGIDPRSIGKAPFQPVLRTPGSLRAREVGLEIVPDGIVDLMPSTSGYIGGDIASDIYVSGLHEEEELSILIDIGTNGEIVMCESGRMVACSTAAGPAFEGYGLYHGCRATMGAIEKINFDNKNNINLEIIGHDEASGICGTGIIDFIAEGFRIGLLDRRGKFNDELLKSLGLDHEIQIDGNSLKACIIARNENSTINGPILITEADIAKIFQSKAAIYAGMNILLKRQNKTWQDIKKLVLAGGFAKHINPINAVSIGLIPPIPIERIEVIGNGSLGGAYLALIESNAIDAMTAISLKIEVIELNMVEEFQDYYIDALFLPIRD